MTFASREDAGRKLAAHLRTEEAHPDLVLGLPRGGVVVAAEVARALHAPLDVLIVRKIGHPRYREFAVGALAEPDVVLLNHQAIEKTHVQPDELEEVVAEEKRRLHEYQQRFEGNRIVDLASRRVLIVDDGLATGASAEAAVVSARQRRASKVWLAVPVASTNAYDRLSSLADQVYALWVDPDFEAVGQYYEEFSQTTDEEVLNLLSHARTSRG